MWVSKPSVGATGKCFACDAKSCVYPLGESFVSLPRETCVDWMLPSGTVAAPAQIMLWSFL